MRVGLFGHGKMGKAIETVAHSLEIEIVDLPQADVCIDFSHADGVLEHAAWCGKQQKPLIIGTTGWEKDREAVKTLIVENQCAALASPNFSLGMALFTQLLKMARPLLHEYEMAGIEMHHSEKKDAPSGTAKEIADQLNMKTPFSSVRCGRLPGTHQVIFDSPDDSITFTHEAHNRLGFARGALKAAQWIMGKKGWFTLHDMLRDLYRSHYPL